MKNVLVATLTLFLLSGCFTSEDELEEKRQECEQTNTCDGPNTEVPIVQVSGTAATGLAMINATVTVTDVDGNNLTPITRTNARGEFTLSFEETVIVPALITVAPFGGKVLQAVLDSADSRVVNVNPITNFVSDKLLASKSLNEVTSGEVAQLGQTSVDTLFGEGLSYQAFSTDAFSAKQTVLDFASRVSVADALLDSLLEVADGQDIDAFLSATEQQGTGLFQSTEFVVALAKNIAKLDGAEKTIADVIDSTKVSEQVASQVAVINAFQDTIEEFVTEVSQAPGINDFIISVSVEGLTTILAGVAETEQGLQVEHLDSIRANIVENLLDDVLQFITSEANSDLNIDDFVAQMNAVADDIVVIINQQEVDFTVEDVDVTALEAAVQVRVSIDTGSNWDQADWDTLTWK